MNLSDEISQILGQYATRPTDTSADFDEVAKGVSPDVVRDGLAHSLRSEQTPSFGNMVGSLFGASNGQQRAGLLGQLIQAAGPAVLAQLSSGGLGKLLRGAVGPAAPQVDPAQAESLSPKDAEAIATAAQKNDPGILDRVADFYSRHPDVVKSLGGAALAIALGHMATKMNAPPR